MRDRAQMGVVNACSCERYAMATVYERKLREKRLKAVKMKRKIC